VVGNTKSDYTETLVIDLKGTNQSAVTQIVSVMNGQAAPFPQGEEQPDADILVILGH